MPTQVIEAEPARAFSAAGVETSIRQIQRGKSTTRSSARASSAAYLVSLAGKQAVYFGRTGDIYVGRFLRHDGRRNTIAYATSINKNAATTRISNVAMTLSLQQKNC